MPNLLLGPLLRYVGETEATIWVETDHACEVEALGHSSRTFHVEGHHYAVVHVTNLERGRTYPYTIKLDGAVAYPEPNSEFPPSVIRTIDPHQPIKLVFGSCRVLFISSLRRLYTVRRSIYLLTICLPKSNGFQPPRQDGRAVGLFDAGNRRLAFHGARHGAHRITEVRLRILRNEKNTFKF